MTGLCMAVLQPIGSFSDVDAHKLSVSIPTEQGGVKVRGAKHDRYKSITVWSYSQLNIITLKHPVILEESQASCDYTKLTTM